MRNVQRDYDIETQFDLRKAPVKMQRIVNRMKSGGATEREIRQFAKFHRHIAILQARFFDDKDEADVQATRVN